MRLLRLARPVECPHRAQTIQLQSFGGARDARVHADEGITSESIHRRGAHRSGRALRSRGELVVGRLVAVHADHGRGRDGDGEPRRSRHVEHDVSLLLVAHRKGRCRPRRRHLLCEQPRLLDTVLERGKHLPLAANPSGREGHDPRSARKAIHRAGRLVCRRVDEIVDALIAEEMIAVV